MQEPEGAVRPAADGDLGMPGIMADVGGAGGQDSQRHGEQQRPPRVPGQDEPRHHRGQGEEVHADHPCVPAPAPLQQPLSFDSPQQGVNSLPCCPVAPTGAVDGGAVV